MSLSKIVFSNTYTYSDFYRRFYLLKEFIENFIYKGNENEGSIMDSLEKFFSEKEISYENKEAMKEWGESFFSELINSGNVYKVFDQIEEDFKKAPLFMLQVPVKFSEKDVFMFGKWFRENINEKAFITVNVDPDISAGCLFSWKSNQYDMSFNRLYKDKHREISKRIKEVVNENS